MDERDLNDILKSEQCFLGTFPRDKLPNVKKRPAALIMNTDKAGDPGEHWVVLFITEENTAEYFDSFGIYPMFREIHDFLESNNIDKVIYSSNPLQSASASTCGAYCVMFIKHRCRGRSFCEFISHFTKNKPLNDLIVTLYKEQ
jgi:hypothetical protein